MVDGLAFLPAEDVEEGMAHLKETCPAELEDLLDYFDSNYVSGAFKRIKVPGNNNMKLKRTPPVFSPKIWTVHSVTLHGGQRTNNICETWNSAFKKLVGHNNPSIYVLIENLQQDCRTLETLMERIARGDPPGIRQKKVTKDLQKKLKKLCEDYVSGVRNIEKFLKGVGSTIRF